jgi:hypothetical protein
MTAQISEELIYQGKTLTLCSEPLGPFLKYSASPFKFYANCTALWRGYVGTWSIQADRLYLVKLAGTVQTDDGTIKPVGLVDLFPNFPEGVFAHWFTGLMRCPDGALLHYVHGGYYSTYERDVFFHVEKGIVLAQCTQINGQAEPGALQHYTLAGMTTFGTPPQN